MRADTRRREQERHKVLQQELQKEEEEFQKKQFAAQDQEARREMEKAQVSCAHPSFVHKETVCGAGPGGAQRDGEGTGQLCTPFFCASRPTWGSKVMVTIDLPEFAYVTRGSSVRPSLCRLRTTWSQDTRNLHIGYAMTYARLCTGCAKLTLHTYLRTFV
jgi:hypothetical protein